MSDQDKIKFSDEITAGIRKAQRSLFERKAKLGEDVVLADANGCPVIIPASVALEKMDSESS